MGLSKNSIMPSTKRSDKERTSCRCVAVSLLFYAITHLSTMTYPNSDTTTPRPHHFSYNVHCVRMVSGHSTSSILSLYPTSSILSLYPTSCIFVASLRQYSPLGHSHSPHGPNMVQTRSIYLVILDPERPSDETEGAASA